MNVLVISDYRVYHATRPEAAIFTGLARQGFQILVMTPPEGQHIREFEEAGIRVIGFNPKKKFSRNIVRQIREVLIREKTDILHLFNNRAIISGIRAAKGLPVKVIVYRGYDGHVHWYNPYAYFKYLHPRVDKIHCNSENVAGNLERQLFFRKGKTVVISKGHDLAWYAGITPADIRQELGIPPDTFLVHTHANHRKMKGLKYLILAMNLLPDPLPLHLLIVGRNNRQSEFRKLLGSGTSQDRVHFLGYRSDNLQLVSACNTHVLASIFGESMPKTVVESMALGIPPIISDIPGNRWLVEHQETGLIFRSKDSSALARAILSLYHNPDLARRLGDQARERIATRFNAEKTVREMKSLYEQESEGITDKRRYPSAL